eukprot:UN19222
MEENYALIIMELGKADLGFQLKSKKKIHSELDTLVIWKQLLEAVKVLHDQRIIHSDLKPSNFLLVGSMYKLIDFGISKKIHDNTINIVRDAGP